VENFNFENGYCVEECGKNTIVNDNNQCESTSGNGSCNSSCETCSKNTDWCLSCPESSETPIVNPNDGTCVGDTVGSCGTGYYVDNTTKSCDKCSTRCADCELAADKCFACWDFFESTLLDWATYKCLSACSSGGFFDSASNSCPACNPVCKTCTTSLPTACTSCNETIGGRQLYLTDGECVLNCRRPYVEDESTNTCVRSTFDIVSPVVIIIIILSVIAVIVMIASAITGAVKGRRGSMLEEIYAYLSFVEFWDRLFLMANLWASAKIFSFAVCFMNIVTTGVLGVFFYNLFLEPIFIHSPHFRNQYKAHKITFLGIIWSSFIVGVNFVRLIYSKVFGTVSTSATFNAHYFFVKPLNNMANFTLILTGFQIILCIVTMFEFSVGEDAWMLSVCGLIINFILVLFQIVKIFQTQRFVRRQYMAL
jgi:hypothetical protein